jgi:DNA-directed RNA polymerase subunit RPC12/RpoP
MSIKMVKCWKCGKAINVGKYNDPNWTCVFCGAPQGRTGMEQRDSEVKARIHCPTCGSNRVSKIGGGVKAGRALLVGPFAIPSMGKSWHCDECSQEW